MISYCQDLELYTVTRWGSDEPFAWAETPTDAMAIQEMEAIRAGADRFPNEPADLGQDHDEHVAPFPQWGAALGQWGEDC